MGNEWISPIEITTPMLCGSHGKQVWKRIGKCVEVLDTQSCPTVCDPMNCSLPGSSIHGILQARILKWVAISFSRGSLRPRDWTQVSHITGRFFSIWAIWEACSKMAFLLRSPWNNHFYTAAAAVKLLQSCLTLHNPIDCSLPGSSVHGIFQARVLEWGAIAFSRSHS